MTKSVDLPPTRTLAALYEKQGLLHQAEEIYRRLLEADPEQSEIKSALEELGKRRSKKSSPATETCKTGVIRQRDQNETVFIELTRWARAIRSRRDTVQVDGRRGLRISVVLGPGPSKRDTGESCLSREHSKAIADIEYHMAQEEKKQDVTLDIIHALDEDTFVKALVEATGRYDALIVNPGSLDLSSKADRFITVDLPVFEVFFGHPPRDRSIPSPVSSIAIGHLAGFGVEGLLLTVQAAIDTVKAQRARMGQGAVTPP